MFWGSIYLIRALNGMKETNNGKLRGGWYREGEVGAKLWGRPKAKLK